MGIDTGRSAPTNQELVHCSSEDLRRVALVAVRELGVRIGEDPEDVLELLKAEVTGGN